MNALKTVPVTIEITAGLVDIMARLHATGLWGRTQEETAERLICYGIQHATQGDGIIASESKRACK